MREWWNQAWRLGLENPTDQTFVAEDTQDNDCVVAFSRWVKPQEDGNHDRVWPVVDKSVFPDMEVAEAFFQAMEDNRRALLGSQPHWSTSTSCLHA